MSRKLFFVLGLAVCLLCGMANAATVYVNSSTGNDSRSYAEAQNSSTPWKTITYAVANISSGDTISIAAGTYNVASGETFPIGTAEPCTITGASAETTIVQGTSDVFRIIDDNVTMENLTVSSGQFAVSLYRNSITNITIRNNILCSTGSNYSKGILGNAEASGINITNNKIYGFNVGIWMQYVTSAQVFSAINHNTIYNCSSYGIYMNSGSGSGTITVAELKNNIVWNNSTDIYSTGGTAITMFDYNCYSSISGITAGSHDITSNPHFVMTSGDDYLKLYEDSLCLNASSEGQGSATPNIGWYQGSGISGSPYVAIKYVSGTGSDSNDGNSAGSPYRTITKATQQYVTNTISVAPGTYNAAAGETFPITIPGGVSLIGTGSVTDVIIQGDQTHAVVSLGTGCTMRGFTVKGIATLGQSNIGGILAGSNCTVQGNIVDGETAGLYGIEIKNGTTGSIVKNNVVYNANYGILGVGSDAATSFSAINNTVYNCTIGGITGVASLCTLDVKNCIVSTCGAGLYNYNWGGEGTLTSTYNCLYNNTSTYSGTVTDKTGDITTDPRFTDATNHNFNLQSDSPCPNMGAYGYWGASTLYMAEGCTSGFTEYLLLMNPNTTDAIVTITFMKPDGTTVSDTESVTAQSRSTINVNMISGLENAHPSAKIVSTIGIIAERAMYWDAGGMTWKGGHIGSGVTATSTTWYLAEGSTQGSFDTWVLLQNPNSTDASVTLTFMKEDGTTVTSTATVPATGRCTIQANQISGLSDSAFSTKVVSTVAIIADRSQYWDSAANLPSSAEGRQAVPNSVEGSAGNVEWVNGHNSPGVTSTSTVWYFAEGCTLNSKNYDEWLLLMNPNASTANVTITFMDDNGNTVEKTTTVGANSRKNIEIKIAYTEMADKSFGMKVESTNGIGIVAERSVYWDAGGITWSGGHSSIGSASTSTVWSLAEGNALIDKNFDEWILILNPSGIDAASIKLTFMLDDGTTVEKTEEVSANTRKSIQVKTAYTELVDKNFSTKVVSTNNVGIVVDRSMYWDAGGVEQASGHTNVGSK